MKVRYFSVGVAIAIVVGIIAFILNDWSLLIKVSGIIGAISILGSAIFTGILGSGDRIRANYTNEEDEDRKVRQGLSSNLLLVGLPSIAMILVYALFIYK